jgi:hypothetical protein
MDKKIPTVKKYGLTPSIKSGLSNSYYILEVKQGSNTFKPGYNVKIVVNNILIGRDTKCGFRFDESDNAVSRIHAEIYKDKEKYMLHHLSKTNQTLLNGRPLNQMYALNSGDEIQFSNGGPIVSFIVPATNKTNSIGLSERLQLFRDQALKPYRNALILISIFFVILTVFGLITIKTLFNQNDTLSNRNDNLIKQISKLDDQIKDVDDQLMRDSLIQVQQANYMKLTEKQIIEMKKQNAKLYKEISEARSQYNKFKNQAESINGGFIEDIRNSGFNQESLKPINDPIKQKQISQVFPGVYFVKADYVTINYTDGTTKRIDLSWSGTAFMTSNGYMVTARHVIEPWNFVSNDETWINNFSTLNVLETNYGAKIVAHLTLNNQSVSKVQFN